MTNSIVALTTLALAGTLAQEPTKVSYEEHVKPIVRKHCATCHNPDRERGNLDVTSYSALLSGGAGGKVVVARKPGASPLFLMTSHLEAPHMPPNSPKLPARDLEILRRWIEDGLLEKADSAALVIDAAKPEPKPAPVSNASASAPMPENLPAIAVQSMKRPAPIVALAASPSAPLVAAPGNRQVLLYQTETRQLLGVLPFPEGDALVLRFSRNGQRLLAGGGEPGQSGRAVVFDVATGKRIMEVGDELDAVLAADISPDGKRIALGGSGKSVKIYAADGKLVHSLKKHADWITCLQFSPEGLLLASSDRNGGLYVWEAGSGKEFWTLRGHTGPVHALSWRHDSNAFASAGQDGQVCVWDMHKGEKTAAWKAHEDGTLAVDFGHGGVIASSGRDKLAKTWDQTGKNILTLAPFQDQVLRVALSHDDRRLIAGDWSGEMRIHTTADGKLDGILTAGPPSAAASVKEPARKRPLAELQATLAELTANADRDRAAAKQAAMDAANLQRLTDDAKQNVTAAEAALAKAKQTAAQIEQLASARTDAAKSAAQQALQSEKSAAGVLQEIEQFKAALSESTVALEEKFTKANVALDAAKRSLKEKQDLLQLQTDVATKLRTGGLELGAKRAEDLVSLLLVEVRTAERTVTERDQMLQEARRSLELARKKLGLE